MWCLRKEGFEVDGVVTIEPTKVAELFWSMSSDEQRVFFNHLGLIAPIGDFSYQINRVLKDDNPTPPLSERGLMVLDAIAVVTNDYTDRH